MRRRLLVAWVFLLAGCSQTEDVSQKLDFYIQTSKPSALQETIFLTKPGKIIGSQEIAVSAQALGRVQQIIVREGQEVLAGQPIVTMADSLLNYGSQVDRAQSALDRTQIQYNSNKISLDNAVSNAEAVLVQAKQALVLAEKSVENSLKIQELSTTSQNLGRETTLASLQDGFVTEKLNLLSLYDDVVDNTKSILNINDLYEDGNSPSYYIGVQDPTQKQRTISLYNILIKTDLTVVNNPSDNEILASLQKFGQTYNDLSSLLNSLEITLNNSLVGATLPQTTLDGYQALVDWLQASLTANKKAFSSFQSTARDAFASLEDGIIGLDLASESADLNLETARINAQNTLLNAEIAVDNAQRGYDQAVDTRNSQLSLLQNSIADAKIWYQDALKQFNKLTVTAPIRGTISDILVDVWQELSTGTPVFGIVSTDNQLVEISVTADELWLLGLWQDVVVNYRNVDYIGTIQSLSRVADGRTQYPVIVALDRPVDLVWDIAEVYIPLWLGNPVLPIDIVTVRSQKNGIIYIYEDKEIVEYPVRIGKVWSTFVEITTPLPAVLDIITSSVENFDDTKYIPVIGSGFAE